MHRLLVREVREVPHPDRFVSFGLRHGTCMCVEWARGVGKFRIAWQHAAWPSVRTNLMSKVPVSSSRVALNSSIALQPQRVRFAHGFFLFGGEVEEEWN